MSDTTGPAKVTTAAVVGGAAEPSAIPVASVSAVRTGKVRRPGLAPATVRGLLAAGKRIKGEIPGTPITADSPGVALYRAMKILRKI